MGIQNGALLPKIASHGLDVGIGAACAAIEGLALFGASRLNETASAKEKFAKYTLFAIAIIAAIGTTIAGSVALGGILLKVSGMQAAQWSALSTVLLSVFGHIQAFKGALSASKEISQEKTPS
ncbi:MAG: hypothetical protein K1X28_08415 [Parachlamydiales bacterium]|nr:hypothetical protein [Parachlamydiales bacterium]